MRVNEEDSLAMERDNFTSWIKQPVDWTLFLTDTSSNTNNEDTKKELQTIHGGFLHIDTLKWFIESAPAKKENFYPLCILARYHLAHCIGILAVSVNVLSIQRCAQCVL